MLHLAIDNVLINLIFFQIIAEVCTVFSLANTNFLRRKLNLFLLTEVRMLTTGFVFPEKWVIMVFNISKGNHCCDSLTEEVHDDLN